jgi:hypothetical protein
MKRIGKRGRLRQQMNAKLAKETQVTWCELRVSAECNGHRDSWAHSKKSRFLVTESDWMEAAGCCLPCHMMAEALSHEAMKELVIAAINRRDL